MVRHRPTSMVRLKTMDNFVIAGKSFSSRLIVVRRVKHAGGFENIVLGEGFPSLCGHLLDQLTGRHVEHVVVGKAVTKTGRRFDVNAKATISAIAASASLVGSGMEATPERPSVLIAGTKVAPYRERQ